jgi:hypothetical protein
MQLWGIDIVGGVPMVDPRTGVLSEAKVVTGVGQSPGTRQGVT